MAMANSDYSLASDEDLPRTLRREKAAREREAQGRTLGHGDGLGGGDIGLRADPDGNYGHAVHNDPVRRDEEVTVRWLRIPFFHLMFFFIKAVLAAIPALILLGALLWLAGDILMATFPELVKMQILIKLPN